MTPVSMTAFGRGDFQGDKRQWTVEIRSVNHRFCDIKVKMPHKYMVLEEKIKKAITARCARGHIEVMINQTASISQSSDFTVNLALAKDYKDALTIIQDNLGLQPPPLRLFAEYPGIITQKEEAENLDEVATEIHAALQEALAGCIKMRQDEGQALKQDLLNRLTAFNDIVCEIDKNSPILLSQKEEALEEKLNKLLQKIDIDPARLAQEVAILVDKSDITEEVVRLKSHIQQFYNFLEDSKPVGRRLDFLLQEFLREINTMASKINDTSTIHKTVELKNEAEKLREQVQNLE